MDALRPRLFVELGVHNGASYCAFCEAVASLALETRCMGVDTWQGDDHAGHYLDAGTLAALRGYHDPLYRAFSTLRQATFDEVAAGMAPGSVDLLHIDGLHTYEAVRHDHATWRPALSNRAVVLFHDIAVTGRSFGVKRYWEEVSSGRPHFAFDHAHGLGVLGHGDDLPPALLDLFNAGAEEADRIRQVFVTLGDRATAERRLSAPLAYRVSPALRVRLARVIPGPVRAALRRALG